VTEPGHRLACKLRISLQTVTQPDQCRELEMLIYLDDYRQARAGTADLIRPASRLKNGTDGADVMNTVCSRATLHTLHTPAQNTLSPDLPDDLSTIDIDLFMNRIYALASQV
jgi:hypothetical protein